MQAIFPPFVRLARFSRRLRARARASVFRACDAEARRAASRRSIPCRDAFAYRTAVRQVRLGSRARRPPPKYFRCSPPPPRDARAGASSRGNGGGTCRKRKLSKCKQLLLSLRMMVMDAAMAVTRGVLELVLPGDGEKWKPGGMCERSRRRFITTLKCVR